jgi:3-oxoacyl-[acyl-carrier protein] reductase
MNGRTALVTGGSRGIGRAVVERFEALGAHVLAPSRREVDLRDGAAVEAYVAALGEPVDILVNDAGVNPLASFDRITDGDLEEALAVNLVAPFRLCRALAPGMAQRGYGRIVNISSIWSLVAKPGRTAYALSKSGLNGLTRSLAVELAGHNVLVNAIAPGFVATEMTYRNNTPEELTALTGQVPVGRLGAPAEIAEMVAFFASARNSFATGQVVVCDGGYSCL